MVDINTLSPASSVSRLRLPGLPKRKVIRIATGCTDTEQFVSTFWRMCEPDGCFVPTTTMRPAGLETVFSLQLADGRPLLRGVGIVRAAWTTAANPYGRPGLFLGFRRLTADSRALVTRMGIRRAAGGAGARRHPDTVPGAEPAYSEMATVAMPALEDAGGGVVAVAGDSDLTERCEPAFADCALDEPPRSAIATILGVAPLPRPMAVPVRVPVVRAATVHAIPRFAATTESSPRQTRPAEVWMFAAAAFLAAFALVLLLSGR